MLKTIHIENIAVIERADVEFSPGLNVLTGETGAGKSIVIDAIGAVIGERTSRDLIRTGAKSAFVSALFSELPRLRWLEEQGIELDENGELLIERSIHADGKNVCRVNGRPILVTQLKELGRRLLNIHGQHDGQQLLDEGCHLDYLDSFGGLSLAREEFAQDYEQVCRFRRELERLRMNDAEKARRIDSLTFQITELEQGDLKIGEEEDLLTRRDILRNAERLTVAVDGGWQALTGGDDGLGVVGLLMSAQSELAQGGRFSDELHRLSKIAEELRFAADDLAEQIRDVRSTLEFYPGELDELESRLDTIGRLKKKYGGTVKEMLSYLDDCRRELDEIQFSEEKIQKLEQSLGEALENARCKGKELSERRRVAAERLALRIRSELEQLDMPKVRFQAAFFEKECMDGMDSTGMDTVHFLMSANIGEDMKPINKIASGGELARIMLALKNVLAENDQVTTMVFDEVDTGVSGRAASKVAQKLFQVSRGKQVLCVTHLPQIAAMGDVHFSVEKGEKSGRTFTSVENLDRSRRKEELARLSGGALTQTMLDSAEELLMAAERYKKENAG